MAIRLLESDSIELSKEYPNLTCDLDNQKITGQFGFCCRYDKQAGILIHENSNESISDEYDVLIDFNQQDDFGFPKVFETSDKIKSHADENGINREVLHLRESDNYCCLGINHKYVWKSVIQYIDDFLPSFFYWHSSFILYGVKPWADFSHGILGLIEYSGDSKIIELKGKDKNSSCHCGSGRKYKRCCYLEDQKFRLVYINQKQINKSNH